MVLAAIVLVVMSVLVVVVLRLTIIIVVGLRVSSGLVGPSLWWSDALGSALVGDHQMHLVTDISMLVQ